MIKFDTGSAIENVDYLSPVFALKAEFKHLAPKNHSSAVILSGGVDKSLPLSLGTDGVFKSLSISRNYNKEPLYGTAVYIYK